MATGPGRFVVLDVHAEPPVPAQDGSVSLSRIAVFTIQTFKVNAALSLTSLPLGQVLTVREACAYLKISRATIYRMIKRKQFPAFRLSGGSAGGWRINLEELERWLQHKSTSGN
jgi:excisionase family DNA binding protein